MTMPPGDPAALRSLARALRRDAGELSACEQQVARAGELPGNSGGFADRAREVSGGLRERTAWIVSRLEAIATEIDRGAAWIEEAQREFWLADQSTES